MPLRTRVGAVWPISPPAPTQVTLLFEYTVLIKSRDTLRQLFYSFAIDFYFQIYFRVPARLR
ncbi:MAG: hypothetical protein WAV20_02190 [Blastocatellia bacterium]